MGVYVTDRSQGDVRKETRGLQTSHQRDTESCNMTDSNEIQKVLDGEVHGKLITLESGMNPHHLLLE